MQKFRVIWNINVEKVVEAENEDDAQNIVCNLDCQVDGSYVEDSFEIVKVMKEEV